MICLVVLLVLCWLITTLVTFNGGMGLRQQRESDLDPDRSDMNMCQFNSALHAFIINKDLNKFAIEQLNERLRLHQDEKYWLLLIHMLLNNKDKEGVYKKMMDTKHYLPVEVFGTDLCAIVSFMQVQGYKSNMFDLYHFLLAIMTPTKKFDESDWEKIYKESIGSTPIQAAYDTDFYLNAVQINMTDSLGNPLDPKKPFPPEFYTTIYKILKYSDFECLFISYDYGADWKHVYAITKTEDGFTYNDDGDLYGVKTSKVNAMANHVMSRLLTLVGSYKRVDLDFHFITKRPYKPKDFNDVMRKWVENVYDKLDDKSKAPALIGPNKRFLLIESLDQPDADISELLESGDDPYDRDSYDYDDE